MVKSLKCATEQELIIIGKIGKPQGIKGAMRVYSLTDFPDRFANLTDAYLNGELIKIKYIHYHNNFMVMDVLGFDSREKAALATGKFLQVKRSEAAPLAENEYYTFDIIGISVYDEKNFFLGTVTNVLKTGSNDVYVTKNSTTGKEILIPALKKVVTKIDLLNKRMNVVLEKEK